MCHWWIYWSPFEWRSANRSVLTLTADILFNVNFSILFFIVNPLRSIRWLRNGKFIHSSFILFPVFRPIPYSHVHYRPRLFHRGDLYPASCPLFIIRNLSFFLPTIPLTKTFYIIKRRRIDVFHHEGINNVDCTRNSYICTSTWSGAADAYQPIPVVSYVITASNQG